MLPVEVRYLGITWSKSKTVLKLEVSREAIELEQTSSGWIVETTAFPNIHHYIGVCIKSNSVKHTPYFKLADNHRQELMPVKVPGTDEVWWIQNSGWDKKGKRYLSELYRTTGRAELIVQEQQLTIENNTFNFTVTELEYYLADFKNSLWMLILNNNSAAKASINKEVPDCFNDNVLKLFHEFIQSAEKIIKKPGMVLCESQGKLPLRKVKPVQRTFREYATKPNAKLLTSRIFLESYDTAENRYIHYCVKRILYVLKSLSRIAAAQGDAYVRKIEQEQERRELLQKKETRKVDSRVYDNEISKIKIDLEVLNQKLSSLVSVDSLNDGTGGEYGTYIVQFSKSYAKSSTMFFSNKLNGEDFQQSHKKYLVVKYPKNDQLELNNIYLSRCEVSITGRYSWCEKNNSSGKTYWELEFHEVTSVLVKKHPLQIELARLIERREQLEGDNWIVQLTTEDLQERKMDNEVAEKKISLYENLQEKMSKFTSSVPVLQSRLVKVISFFNEQKVKSRSDCPNTMVFIQNPSYASAKSLFRRISELNGVDELMLDSLMIIDDIGLVNVANLYEKWCLLQIIKVLTQVFQFDIEDNWQRFLIDAVLKNSVDIDIKLQAPDRQQSIILTYEKLLDSGKRPDFVIDLISMEYEKDQEDLSYWRICGERRDRLVLDAKFRGAMTESQLQELISGLYTDKDYSENKANQVFVVHPSPNVINERTSPLEWGYQNDYGQSNEINHRYGGIFVSPSLRYSNSLEHLQRLIGLFLQANSQIPDKEKDLPWHNMNCISCGNADHKTLILRSSATKAGSGRWIIKCKSCGLRTIKTICSSCHHPLFKNGPKWTYHRTRAEQMSNVVCPNCETFL